MAKILRTPTKVRGGITPEERVALDAHARLWIRRAFRSDPIEPSKIVPAIENIYKAAGFAKPRVVIVPSPLVMAFAYGASATILADTATDAATYAATLAATDAATYAAIRAATRGATATATYAATDAATRAATRDATYAATLAATRAATLAATRAATRAAITAKTGAISACFDLSGNAGLKEAARWHYIYQGGNFWAPYDCYLTGMRDIIGLRLPEHEKYNAWEQAAIHGGFRVVHPHFCIVSDFPEYIKIDAQNRPHCENGPSHRWRDGWALYHWHGTAIPSEWIEEKTLTAKIALTWDNIEQRRCACEIVTWDRIIEELKAKMIDRDNDPEIGELIEVTIPDIGEEKFLRVLCPTGRRFCIPVPRHLKTAIDAQAWCWDIDPNEFMRPEVRT